MNLMIRAFNSAAGKGPLTRAVLGLLGLCFFLGALGLFVWLSLWTDRLLMLPPLLPAWPARVLSTVLAMPGSVMTLWCLWLFLRSRGTPVPLNPPRELVTSGPYAYSRNPMLTGTLILLYSLAFALRSISMALVFLPLAFLLLAVEIRRVEEPELEMRFGQEYLRYRKATPMFIPRLRRKH